MTKILEKIISIDNELSKRFISLDPGGYFIIYPEREEKLIYAEHFTNVINEQGLAADPETGEIIPCEKGVKRICKTVYKGRTAKELCLKIFEEIKPCPVTMLDHAAYLGREFIRAQIALINSTEYIQD
jgi:dihydropteroate synthase